MKFQSKFIYFHSRKCIWKCRRRNGVHLFRPQCVNINITVFSEQSTAVHHWRSHILTQTNIKLLPDIRLQKISSWYFLYVLYNGAGMVNYIWYVRFFAGMYDETMTTPEKSKELLLIWLKWRVFLVAHSSFISAFYQTIHFWYLHIVNDGDLRAHQS